MPELPEVETFKRYLDSTSLHQRITGIEVRDAYVLKRVSARELARRLKGRRFENSRRHGKHLFVRAGNELWLRLHFGMTGWLQYLKRDEETPNTARVLFSFANNRRLAFDDQRKFGEVELIKDVDEFLQTRGIGPDALDIGLSEFKAILANASRRSESDFAEPAVDRRDRQPLRRRNSFPCMHAPGHCSGQFK